MLFSAAALQVRACVRTVWRGTGHGVRWSPCGRVASQRLSWSVPRRRHSGPLCTHSASATPPSSGETLRAPGSTENVRASDGMAAESAAPAGTGTRTTAKTNVETRPRGAVGANGTGALTFQEAILRLQIYWAERGCLLWRPYNAEVGAGTMNPATFLRALGPEPWNVAYEEPSVRPDDSRYGENPNRIQQHTQFQVILKPAPPNSQELLLGSYAALGIDIDAHDIRFVEDNWESPALGAWGLGYEVWMDGCEITQYTYFQQVGGFSLDPIALEITYGMERILMTVQGKSHFKDILYAPGITYGEVFLQNEIEMSRYNLEEADVERQRHLFDLSEAEARELLQKRLPIPAYHYVLRTSHTFNILDARGAVGVAERAAYFRRMRSLAREVAALWLERRAELCFPLGQQPAIVAASAAPTSHANEAVHTEQVQRDAADTVAAPGRQTSGEGATLLIEIGTEELPPADLDAAVEQLREHLLQLLHSSRLLPDAGRVKVHVRATPRRHAILVEGVAHKQPDQWTQIRGPPSRVAIDAQTGELTAVGQAFAQRHQIRNWEAETERKATKQGEYIFLNRTIQGQRALPLLHERLVDSVLAKIQFRRSMRWNESGVLYSRPVRWLLAMLDDQVIPVAFGGVVSAPVTWGLRASGIAPQLPVSHAQLYDRVLERANIVAEVSAREQSILRQANALALQQDGVIYDPERTMLHEVARLIESPQVLLGSFDEAYLALPSPVLITVMQKHQRYFPIEASGSMSTSTEQDSNDLRLRNAFVIVANGRLRNADLVRRGNEAVIQARFADAKFFYEADLKRPLASFVPKLEGLIFEERLGSMLDKTRRIEALVPFVVDALAQRHYRHHEDAGVPAPVPSPCDSPVDTASPRMRAPSPTPDWEQVRQVATEAAALCKADLATQLVVEFTSLAGIMGEHYARKQGYRDDVARALFEIVLPRSAGDQVPRTPAGVALALSDRMDSLVGLFGIGLAPKANSDPFGLRRAALGVVQILCRGAFDGVELSALAEAAAAVYAKQHMSIREETLADLLDFMDKRFEQWLLDPDSSLPALDVARGADQSQASATGLHVSAVRAVLQCHRRRPARAYRVLQQLYPLMAEERFRDAVTCYLRPARLVRGQPDLDGSVDPALFQDQVEVALWEALRRGGFDADQPPFTNDDVLGMVQALRTLRPSVDAFLDGVMVMVDEPALRRNRLNLCARIARIPASVLDMEQLQGWF
jgi:glycyl-tRNA synthetase